MGSKAPPRPERQVLFAKFKRLREGFAVYLTVGDVRYGVSPDISDECSLVLARLKRTSEIAIVGAQPKDGRYTDGSTRHFYEHQLEFLGGVTSAHRRKRHDRR